MNVVVNGALSEVPTDSTVADIVRKIGHRGPSHKGVAVALNGEIVARDRWSATRVAESDRIEILAAIQGG